MTNVPVAPDEVQDPAEKNEPGIGAGRDPERSPMPWDGTPLAGFTTGRPWLPFGADQSVVNVATLEQDDRSLLNLYRELIALRRTNPIMVTGSLQAVSAENSVLRYERVGSEGRMLVLLNLSNDPVQTWTESGTIVLSTCQRRGGEKVHHVLALHASQGLIIAPERFV
jgi:alpha-glucosidase